MITKQQIGLLQSSKYIEILFSRRVAVIQIHLQFTIENRLLVMKTLSVPVSVPILLAQQNHVKFQILLVDNKLHQRLKFTCTQKLFHRFAHFYWTTVLYITYIYWLLFVLLLLLVWPSTILHVCVMLYWKNEIDDDYEDISLLYTRCVCNCFCFYVFMIVVGRHILWWEHFTVKQLILCVMADLSEFSKRRYTYSTIFN